MWLAASALPFLEPAPQAATRSRVYVAPVVGGSVIGPQNGKILMTGPLLKGTLSLEQPKYDHLKALADDGEKKAAQNGEARVAESYLLSACYGLPFVCLVHQLLEAHICCLSGAHFHQQSWSLLPDLSCCCLCIHHRRPRMRFQRESVPIQVRDPTGRSSTELTLFVVSRMLS